MLSSGADGVFEVLDRDNKGYLERDEFKRWSVFKGEKQRPEGRFGEARKSSTQLADVHPRRFLMTQLAVLLALLPTATALGLQGWLLRRLARAARLKNAPLLEDEEVDEAPYVPAAVEAACAGVSPAGAAARDGALLGLAVWTSLRSAKVEGVQQ